VKLNLLVVISAIASY